MTHDDRSLERAARTWLEAGPTQAPDRAVDGALLRIQTTTQERDLRIPWRLPNMFTNRLAAAALALVLIVAAGGFALSRLSGAGQSGGGPMPAPSPTTAPTIAPTASPTPVPTLPTLSMSDSSGSPLPAGTYRVNDFAFPFDVTLPAGWVNQGYTPNSFGLHNTADNTFLAMVVVKSVYPDPCHTETAPKTVAPGVNALFAALSKMKGFTVTGVTDAVVSGAAAKSFTLANSINLQKSGCSNQQVLWIGRDGDGNPVLETPSGADGLWIADTSATMSPGVTVLIGGPPSVVETINWVGLPLR